MGTNAKVAGLFLGEFLGGGIARRVYAYRPEPMHFVVKVQTDGAGEDHDYQNIAEWTLWCESRGKPLEEYLAPCLALSPCGGSLLQVRCEPCPRHLLPAKVPKVLGDLHTANFGIFEGRPVVMDYGRNYAIRMAANAKAMRKVRGDGPYTYS